MRRCVLVTVYLSLGTACTRTHATPPPPAPAITSPHPLPAVGPTTPAPVSEPQPDHDHDALPDPTDRCPDIAEDPDGFEDDDGCPDRDNDGDGVLDAHTWTGTRWTNCDGTIDHGVELDCRNLPEDLDGLWDEDGCPDLITVDHDPPIVDIQYDPNTLKLPPAALDIVVADAAAHPDQRYWLDVHCDSRRTDKQSLALTRRLALAVVAELVRRGVAEARLDPRPFGESMPIADNKTPAGRKANNRLVVHLEGPSRLSGLPAPPLLCPPGSVPTKDPAAAPLTSPAAP